MPARSIGRGTISLGMVSIPVKLYTATRPQRVGFNLLHHECGSPISQLRVCKAHGEPAKVLQSEDMVKAFEHSRGQYVHFTADELKQLEVERPKILELVEFVPEDTVDFLYIEKTFYLGPDVGGEDGYALLAATLGSMKRLAVGTFASRGHDTLVLLRAYRGGLLLHEAYYANEVLPWSEVPIDEPRRALTPIMKDTARLLVKQLERARFEPERFRDEWSAKVMAAVERKVAGNALALEPEQPRAEIVDLVEALKRSVVAAEQKVESSRDAVAKSTVLPKGGPKKASPRKPAEAKKKRTRGES